MIRYAAIALALLLQTSPGLALSCLRPDVARSYAEAAASDRQYVVVHGTLSFRESRLPQAVGNDSPPMTEIRARLTGKALSRTGFDHEFDRNITLRVACFGPWCGGAASGEPYLGFIERGPDGYALEVTPCGGLAFANPTDDMLGQVVRCFQGERCKPNSR